MHGPREWTFGLALAAVIWAGVGGGCARLKGGGSAGKSEDEKGLYALGTLIARNLTTLNLTPGELDIVKTGLSDAVLKKKSLSIEEARGSFEKLARSRATAAVEREKQRAKPALEAAAREPGAIKTSSGLIIRTVRPGTGASPEATSRVKVHYEGRLTDGTVFDSSIKRAEPAMFSLSGVVACWREGVGRMKVGEKAVLTCPAAIAYGDNGQPPMIPGGATLIFDVELLEIMK